MTMPGGQQPGPGPRRCPLMRLFYSHLWPAGSEAHGNHPDLFVLPSFSPARKGGGRREWEETVVVRPRTAMHPRMHHGNQSSRPGAMPKDLSVATIKDAPLLLKGSPGLHTEWHSRNPASPVQLDTASKGSAPPSARAHDARPLPPPLPAPPFILSSHLYNKQDRLCC